MAKKRKILHRLLLFDLYWDLPGETNFLSVKYFSTEIKINDKLNNFYLINKKRSISRKVND